MQEVTFIGGGCNGSGVIAAVSKSIHQPSKENVPAGATWPFVTLTLGDGSADFKMAHIQRLVTPADCVVRLSKYGYIFFRTQEGDKDFGFATPRIGALLNELNRRGFHLDESCKRNMLLARVSLVIGTGIPLAIVILVTTLIVLKPNGL